MKKLIVGLMMCITLVCLGYQTSKAQNIKREGKTFIVESSHKVSNNEDIATTYIWKDSKGNEYPIFLHKYTKGEKVNKWGAYVWKKSVKTGKEYKYYIPDSTKIATIIIKEMNI